MTRNHIFFIAAALLAAAVSTSCNGDVFVDSNDLPEVSDVTIDNDGGQWESAFSRKGLTKVALDVPHDEVRYVKYFDRKGTEVKADCPASDLGAIVYENPMLSFNIGLSGDMIYIGSLYNASESGRSFTLHLDYGYGENKTIRFTLTPGRKLQKTFCITTGELQVVDNFASRTRNESFHNDSPVSQKLVIQPYLDVRPSDEAVPSDEWAVGLEMDLPMLFYNGHEWEWREFGNIRLGERRDFAMGQSSDEEIVVRVAPYSTARITYTLKYSRATRDGVIGLFNPVADLNLEIPVTWTSVYATSYEYTVEYE